MLKCHNMTFICALPPIKKAVSFLNQVSIMLPYPLEKCVTYPILLPRISCTQVEDKKCMAVPRVREGLLLTVNKCSINFGDPECSETILTLPRQGCPSKVLSSSSSPMSSYNIISRWQISRISMSMWRKPVMECRDEKVTESKEAIVAN